MRSAAWCLLGLLACDHEGPPPADACGDVPITTWANFGQGFVIEQCQACHASSATDRRGAPADVTFDDEAQTLAWADRILARVEEGTMPPRGGVDDDDIARLRWWLDCE